MEVALDPSRTRSAREGLDFAFKLLFLPVAPCARRVSSIESADHARSLAPLDRLPRATSTKNAQSRKRAILHRSLHREVVERLRELILAGELEPRSRVNEAALCEHFGISRTPLREAIKLLAAEGLLDLLPNRRARVAALSAVEIEELLQVIGAIEGAGAELAAERVTPEELAAIEAVQRGDARSLERTRLRPLFRAKP
jgi:DNA-binding GntR family transcriptional regulator